MFESVVFNKNGSEQNYELKVIRVLCHSVNVCFEAVFTSKHSTHFPPDKRELLSESKRRFINVKTFASTSVMSCYFTTQ